MADIGLPLGWERAPAGQLLPPEVRANVRERGEWESWATAKRATRRQLAFKGLDHPIHAVFIRAPLVERLGPEAEALATLPDGRVVAARQGHLLATAFHPELTPDTSLHAWFIESCKQLARSRVVSS